MSVNPAFTARQSKGAANPALQQGQSTTVSALAAEIKPTDPPMKLRMGVVIDVQDATGRKVKTDQTGDAWISRSEDMTLTIGDRVWMVQQGSVFIVAGRLNGEPGAVPIGTIVPFAGNVAPPGWMVCDGTAISRSTYSQLFALCGGGYGAGDGSTTFNIPNLRGRFPLGSADNHFQTTTGGVETVTLTAAQVPSHDHGSAGGHSHALQGFYGDFGTAGSGGSIILAATSGSAPLTSVNGAHTHASFGGGGSHDNMPPYLTVLYIVRVL